MSPDSDRRQGKPLTRRFCLWHPPEGMCNFEAYPAEDNNNVGRSAVPYP